MISAIEDCGIFVAHNANCGSISNKNVKAIENSDIFYVVLVENLNYLLSTNP